MRGHNSSKQLGQSRAAALVETAVNIGSGMILAFMASQLAAIYSDQIAYYIWSGFSWEITASSNAVMTVVFTVISVARSYFWRRLFNKKHVNKLKTELNR